VRVGAVLAQVGQTDHASGPDSTEQRPVRTTPREPELEPVESQIALSQPPSSRAEPFKRSPRNERSEPAQDPESTQTPQASNEAPRPGLVAPMSRLRLTFVHRMTESLKTSAQLTTVQEVDVSHIARLQMAAKADLERREGVKLTFLPFFGKAVIETLAAFPAINASISDDGKSVTYHQDVHLAIAVDTPRGLLAPVIRDAHHLGVTGLAHKIADLAERTRASTVGPDELSGGTFTITNIGSVGALFDTPIINQPQVAILATGAIYRRPAVVIGPDGDEQIGVRSMCYLPMTYDHRLIDGAEAGRFVSAVRARLEQGAFESELGR
jgi:pyruvate dehydrogenase E2 component (dihydrolipoamide acetyltransferase)